MTCRPAIPARSHLAAIARLFGLCLAVIVVVAAAQLWSLEGASDGASGGEGAVVSLDVSVGEQRQRLEEAFGRFRLAQPALR